MSKRYNLTFPPKTAEAIAAMAAFKELSISTYLGQLARADHDAHVEIVRYQDALARSIEAGGGAV